MGDALCTWNPITGSRGAQLMPRQMNVSNAKALESLDHLEGLEGDVVLVGHGEPCRESPKLAVGRAREKAGS